MMHVMRWRWWTALAGLVVLAGCGESAARPVGALPTVPIAAPAPVIQPTTPPAATISPVASVALPPPIVSPTTVMTPTFVPWRDSRGVFALDLPANWNNRAVPEGIGVTALSFNGLATFSLSFGFQTARLSPEQARQLAESTKDRLLANALVKDPQFGGQARDDGYVLTGQATINTQPTAIEIIVRQTPGGAIVLETWKAPLEIWNDVQRQYVAPMRASLTIDDQALAKLR